MSNSLTASVTLRAFIQRINRELAKNSKKLKALRGERDRHTLGDYFILDIQRNVIVNRNVEPEALGREMGLLQKWERVEE